jgi:hypothetical protein
MQDGARPVWGTTLMDRPQLQQTTSIRRSDGGSTTHDIECMELSTSIVHEATASFYATAAFNNTAQKDCAFYHPQYSNLIDCEFGQSLPDYDIPTGYMKMLDASLTRPQIVLEVSSIQTGTTRKLRTE